MPIDALHTIGRDGYTVTFMGGADDEVDTVYDIDVEVQFADGTRWSATMMTPEAIAGVLRKWSFTGETLGGIFFRCPDLVITREPGIPAMMQIIEGLVDGSAGERLQDVFQQLEPDDDDD